MAFATVLEAPPRRRPVVRRRNGYLPPPPPPTGGGDGPERDPEPRRPFLDNARLATLFLIGGEIMFFGGLVVAFFVLRIAAPVWPPPDQPRLPVGVTGVNTLVLLSSSVLMIGAVRALARKQPGEVVRRLAWAGALGLVFLAVQGYEWARLVGFGLTVSSGAYGATFYTLIGVHGVHVLGALVWLAVVLMHAALGRYADGPTAGLRACAIYWHFIVALWPILYVAVYLL
ncbi:MAG: heme-copper oxidase subunit III [Candidatus Rokuibacteriota bacterium]|nr:MAG: heme-copper oxidase subunit III [Candidatus Rokubacteria bacterium]